MTPLLINSNKSLYVNSCSLTSSASLESIAASSVGCKIPLGVPLPPLLMFTRRAAIVSCKWKEDVASCQYLSSLHSNLRHFILNLATNLLAFSCSCDESYLQLKLNVKRNRSSVRQIWIKPNTLVLTISCTTSREKQVGFSSDTIFPQ